MPMDGPAHPHSCSTVGGAAGHYGPESWSWVLAPPHHAEVASFSTLPHCRYSAAHSQVVGAQWAVMSCSALFKGAVGDGILQ